MGYRPPNPPCPPHRDWTPGLMQMADVQPSGMEHKTYEPAAAIDDTFNSFDPTEEPTGLSLMTVIQIMAFIGLIVSGVVVLLR